MFKVYEKQAKRIFNKTKVPGADWSINHYSGCKHGCVYCYARFICRWRKEKDKWGEFVDVKINAPELVEKESKNKKGSVLFCTTSDPYQQVEKKYKLTRKILKKINPELEIIMLTKSDLVLRDIDIYKRFKKCSIGFSIGCLDDKIKVFEPYSSRPSKRLEALKKLHKAGLSTYVFVGPIFPYITNLENIFKKTSEYVDVLMFEDFNLSGCRPDVFRVIKKHFPSLVEKYKKLDKTYWFNITKEIKRLSKKYKKPIEIYFKHTGSLRFK